MNPTCSVLTDLFVLLGGIEIICMLVNDSLIDLVIGGVY